MFGFLSKRGPPDERAVAERAVALKCVVMHGLTAPPREIFATISANWSDEDRAKLRSVGESVSRATFDRLGKVQKALSSWEKEFLRTTFENMTEQQQVDASWRAESLSVMAWALRAEPTLAKWDEQVSPEDLKDFAAGDLPSFVASARLRDRAEIEAARDLAELWHWRSRTRQLIEEGRPLQTTPEMREQGLNSYEDIVRMVARAAAERADFTAIDEDFPAFGKAYRTLDADEWSSVSSIARERHFALNWLCGHSKGNDWDGTPTDT